MSKKSESSMHMIGGSLSPAVIRAGMVFGFGWISLILEMGAYCLYFLHWILSLPVASISTPSHSLAWYSSLRRAVGKNSRNSSATLRSNPWPFVRENRPEMRHTPSLEWLNYCFAFCLLSFLSNFFLSYFLLDFSGNFFLTLLKSFL